MLARNTLGVLKKLKVNNRSESGLQVRYKNDQVQTVDEKAPDDNGNLVNFSILKSGFHNLVIATQISVEEEGITRDVVRNISVTTGSKPIIFYSSTAAYKRADDSYAIYRQVTYQNSSEAYKLAMEEIDRIKASTK